MPPQKIALNVKPAWLIAFTFICSTIFFLLPLYEEGTLTGPPEPGDGPDYDSIAFNLAKGIGFGHSWSNETWRLPYEQNNSDGRYNELLNRKGDVTTAYRPPLYPIMLAAEYTIFGRNFAIARITNALLFAFAVVCTASLAYRFAGILAGGIVLLLASRDFSYVLWTQSLYSEALATALIAFVVIQLLQPLTKRSTFFIGVTIGFLVLTKTMFILWAPFIIGLCLVRTKNRNLWLQQITYVTVGVLLVSGPWFIRNIAVTKAFLPLGTLGGVSLIYDYSDIALQNHGLWLGRYNEPLLRDFPSTYQGAPGLEREIALHYWTQARANLWIATHPDRIPALMAMKLSSFWWRDTLLYQKLLILLALFGLYRFRREPELCIPCVAFIAIQSLTVAITHTAPAGRFLIPLYPVLYVLAAIGLQSVMSGEKSSKDEDQG